MAKNEAAEVEQTTGDEVGAPETQGQADEPTEKKLSPKNKKSRGIDPNLITTWVPFDQTAELRTMIARAASVRDQKVPDLLAELLNNAVKQESNALEADASKYEPTQGKTGPKGKNLEEMTPEELEAYAAKQRANAETAISRAEKAANAAREMLAAARARQAAKQA